MMTLTTGSDVVLMSPSLLREHRWESCIHNRCSLRAHAVSPYHPCRRSRCHTVLGDISIYYRVCSDYGAASYSYPGTDDDVLANQGSVLDQHLCNLVHTLVHNWSLQDTIPVSVI